MDEEGQEICQAEPHPSEDTGAVQVLGQHLQALHLLRWQVQIITSDVAPTCLGLSVCIVLAIITWRARASL